MAIAENLKRYLDARHAAFELEQTAPFHSAQEAAALLAVSPREVVQAVPMRDQFGLVLAVIASDRQVNYEKMSRLFGRALAPATSAEVAAAFRDCQGNVLPPIGEAYGVRTILDDSLADGNVIYFSAGDGETLVKVNSHLFFHLQQNARLGTDFTDTGHGDARPAAGVDANGIFDKLEQLGRLPAMPEMAQAVLALHADPLADAKDLAAIVSRDPSLAALVMRYAHSPLFGYRGALDSLQDAISRVLGFNVVMSLAMGLATAKPFRIQRRGPLGLDAHWRHAVYSAALAQALTREIKPQWRPKPGLAYLAGLLHNFGHLLFGALFKKEFAHLNDAILSQPQTPVTDLETGIFGVTHAALGARLLASWGLQDEVVAAVQYHHESVYEGAYGNYVYLVQLVDYMLKGHGMGEAVTSVPAGELLDKLGLTEVQTLMVMNRVLQDCEGLNVVAQQVVA